MLKLVTLLSATAALFFSSTSVGAQQKASQVQPSPPQLLLDTGGHVGLVKGLIFTADGNQLISTGEDKAIRIWDWRSGKTVRVIRGEIGPGSHGKVYTMALSPDGKLLAAAGWTHAECAGRCGDIRIYDFATGELQRLLQGHTNVVYRLAFSRDGRRLVSGGSDRLAMVWEVETGRLVHKLAHTNHVHGVAFSLDGTRVVTGDYDGAVRIWDAATGESKAMRTEHKDRVFTVAISPTDGTIATAGSGGKIHLRDGTSGAVRATLDADVFVGGLAFSPDGTRLMSTCVQKCKTEITEVRVWDVAAGQTVTSYKVHDNIVLASAISPDGKLAATAGGNSAEIHVWDLATGQRILGASGAPVALKGNGASPWAVAFSPDGRRIAWGQTSGYKTTHERGPLEFQMRLFAEGGGLDKPERLASADIASFRRAEPTHAALGLVERIGGSRGSKALLDLSRNGKVIATLERELSTGDDHRSYSFSLDGRTIFSGGSWGVLSAFDVAAVESTANNQGKPLIAGKAYDKLVRDFIGHEGDVFALAVSSDGKLLLSASADNTLRLWNARTRELLVTFFHGTDGEWVMWTPAGYYAGSANAGRLVGWHLNQGSDKAARYVTSEVLKEVLNRPDVIASAIKVGSAKTAIKEAGLDTLDIATLVRAAARR